MTTGSSKIVEKMELISLMKKKRSLIHGIFTHLTSTT